MATTASGAGVTQINKSYLLNLQTQLQDILDQVEAQLRGLGTTGTSTGTTNFIQAVNSSLSVVAGPAGFQAGADLNNALKSMGGSVNDQLTWLQKVLTDMISEITTTVNSFTSTEQLNEESVDQLMTDFQQTIASMSSPPGAGTTPPPATSAPPASS